MTDVFLADPALYGLDGRVPGSPCPVPCSRDCDRGCHEAHKATRLLHDPYYCQQLTLGRGVSESSRRSGSAGKPNCGRRGRG